MKNIAVKGNKVYLTSADSSLRPLLFTKWECTGLSKILEEEGREAFLARIGQDVWNGELRLYKGSKLCNLFIEARNSLPNNLGWHNFYGETAGKFLAKMVMKLEVNPSANLSVEVADMLKTMNDRDYILSAAKKSGYNFLNFADECIQKDREFALSVLAAGSGKAHFDYPTMYTKDKAFALEALKLNGCNYRSLDKSLQADRDVIFAAFKDTLDGRYHEHLPDLIPVEVYCSISADRKITVDTDFVCELLNICPALHMNRANWLLEHKDVVLKWCEVGKFFPYDVSYVPTNFLLDADIQEVLQNRFKGTEKYEVLIKKLEEKGVVLKGKTVDALLANATRRAEENLSANTKEVLNKETALD